MPRIPPAREGNPSLSPTTTISGSRAPTHPRLILAVRWRPYGRPRRTPGSWGGGLPGWEAPPPWPSPTWMRRVIHFIYIENIFNSDYLRSKEKPA